MKMLVVALCSWVLVGCGGGGGDAAPAAPAAPAGPVTSSLSFPLRTGFNAIAASGATSSLTANGTTATRITDGDCSGTQHGTVGPANVATTFEGAPALSAVSVTTLAFSNCTPASAVATSTSYYDSNYLPLGYSVQGGDYAVFLVPPTIPNSVKVGDVGIVGTQTIYYNSTKTTIPPIKGSWAISFIVEPDTATTAIVNRISKRFDSGVSLASYTVQERYRITSTGALTLISVDIQFAGGSTIHLVFR